MTNAFKRIEATPSARMVAYMLADCCNELTGRCDPSWSTIMRLTSLSRSTVARAVRSLEKAGHITVVPRTGIHPLYRLHPVVCAEPDVSSAESGTPAASIPGPPTHVMMTPPPSHDDTPPVSSWYSPRVTLTPESEGNRIQPERTRRVQADAQPPLSGNEVSNTKTNPGPGPGAGPGPGPDSLTNTLELPSKPQKKERRQQRRPHAAPVPPECLQAVEAFALELNLPRTDGRWFWLKHEETGWRKANGSPVLDWRATMRTWEAGGYFPSQKRIGGGPGAGGGPGSGGLGAGRAPGCFDLNRPRPVMTL